MTMPYQDFFKGMPRLLADLIGLVGMFFVVNKLAAPVLAVYGNQDPAPGVNDTIGAGMVTEAAEDHRMDHP